MAKKKEKEKPVQGCITKRDDKGKIWQVRVYLGKDPRTGKRLFHTETVHGTKHDAEEKRAKIYLDRRGGEFVPKTNTTLDQYLIEWQETVAKQKLGERTFDRYRYYIKQYISPVIGMRKLSEIKPFLIQRLYAGMLDRKLAPRTVRYVHTILSSALSNAVRWQMLPNNPCRRVDLPREQHREMKSLTPDEATAFLSAATQDRYGLALVLALVTGCRPGEYLGLKWADIDQQAATVTVQRTIQRRAGGGWYFTDTKNGHSRRTIPLPLSVLQSLKDLRIRQNHEKLKATNYQSHDLIFCTKWGAPINPRTLVQKHFKKVLRVAGLDESIRLYDLRHSCATLLLAANENPKVVSERLGHSKIGLTMDTYSHVLPSMQRAASDKLEKILKIG